MPPAKADVITRCKCGCLMSIAVVEQLPDRSQHTFICEVCAAVGRFCFPLSGTNAGKV